MKIRLEYIWLDGYKPEPNLRSKIKKRQKNFIDLTFSTPIQSLIIDYQMKTHSCGPHVGN